MRPRLICTASAIFGAIATLALTHAFPLSRETAGLLQAALGIYGVTAYSVTRRTREFCIRLAFGARWRDLVKLVVTRGTLLAVLGLIIGSAGGLALGRLLSSLLYQVRPTAPEILLIPAGILLLVVFAATYLPMLRLLKLDPARGLRHE